MRDVGDTIRLRYDCRSASGALVSADQVTLTITLPDGGSVTPEVANPPDTAGRYQVDHVITEHGRHVVRWVTTGPDTAHADVFNAVSQSWPAIVGLTETKNHLKKTDPDDIADDEELRGFILSASAVVEDIVGAVARRAVVETVSGGEPYLRLSTIPILSVDEITVDGRVVDEGEWSASESGLIARRSGRWPAGLRNIQVSYQAGRQVVPPNIVDGVLELIRVNWRPQAGGNYSPFDLGGQDDFGVSRTVEGSLQGVIRLGFFVPNTVSQRLQPQRRAPVVL